MCFPGYIGATCNGRLCPTGLAWADYPTATDAAHNLAECSAMGSCDRSTGKCSCATGFEGIACERMSCPSCSNGRCISMREAAAIQDNTNFFVATTYSLWDADKIFGCQCDNGYTGFDCSQRTCPKGDDPMTTGQWNEVQRLNCLCDGCTGTFALTFRRRTTANISPTMTAAQLETELEKIDTIHGVTVTLSGSGSTICDADGATASITFTNNPGDMPLLQVQSRLTGGSTTPAVYMTDLANLASTPTFDGVANPIDGTREEVDCSNRGLCDTTTGVCRCYPGFSSSNGAGGSGPLGDCGYGTTAACPTTANGVCDGRGSCSGSPFVCTCITGFTGMDCTIRTCASGIAWFDGATAVDTAHAMATCSNKGACDTVLGACTCLSPFTGSACQQLKCPGNCNGGGTCKTMQQLALAATATTGDLLGVTYGNTLNNPSTWDYNKIQGCDCIKSTYFGHYSDAFGEVGQYDCSTMFCPRGADPFETGKVNEKQSITCQADGGAFALTFRQQTTAAIPFNALTTDVKAALEKLTSVRSVAVTFSAGSTVCGTAAAVSKYDPCKSAGCPADSVLVGCTLATTIEFTFMQGDLPPMTVASNTLTLSSVPTTPTITDNVVQGTKANVECSARGTCGTFDALWRALLHLINNAVRVCADRSTGICSCFNSFLSSDGNGNFGARGDCGYQSPYATIS